MHHVIRLIALALLASPIAATAQTFVIKPGRAEAIHAKLSAAQVAGTFALTPSRNGGDGRSGGGCLVFQTTAGDHRCTIDADCRNHAGTLFPAAQPAAGGYCAADRLRGKQCWYRPPDPASGIDNRGFIVSRYCVKSPRAPLPVGIDIRLEAVDAFPLGPQPTRWRITTCHNLAPPDATAHPACARADAVEGRDKATLFGTVKRFRP